ncbi:transposase [uncultured spirochete]|uniref:Transposase n=1 Tax=uncultured spirochete TaxID=156406 RepID=A0A3P3XQT7_9SPIR|nr:transposase [uncultured spirochete]
MAQVKQFDKRSGITYVYESKAYWDKEKHQSRCTRTLIGRFAPDTGEVIATDGRGRKRKAAEPDIKPTSGPISVTRTRRLFYGATSLLDQIGETVGITADLKQCFPDNYKNILSIAYFLILEEHSSLMRFSKWAALHRHPYGKDIPSQRSSELFQSITEEQKMKFFRLQGSRRAKDEFWAYDSTSISSYSEHLKQVKWGKNKEYEPLAQINLVLLFGETSNLPFYYRKLAGNIPDVKTVNELVRELNILGYRNIKLVMDRGFYSAENINALYKTHYKFIQACGTSLSYARNCIKKEAEEMRRLANYNEKYCLYMHSETISWDYTQERPYKGDTITGDRRMYLHLYYNPEKAVEDEMNLNRGMLELQRELLTGQRNPDHEKDYAKYFEVTQTPVRGVRVKPIQEAMESAKERYGYFVLISNEIKDPVMALELYRNRDVAEKAFGNIKERLNGRRTLVASDASLEGKLFVEFVALIYLAYIKKKMQEKGLYATYTLQGLLDELDVIECFTEPGKAPIVGEILKKQKQIYIDMGVSVPLNPASLC